MLGRFSGDSRCAVACHKLDDGQSWDKELPSNLKANEDFLVAPSLDALCGVAGQFGYIRGSQKIVIVGGKPFPLFVQPGLFRLCKMEPDNSVVDLRRFALPLFPMYSPLGALYLSGLSSRSHRKVTTSRV